MAFHIKIGNYRFSKNLGTGSFGKVKLAYNEVTGHKVAVKILNKKKIKQQGVFEKVKREIKVLRQFNHPHIIKHYEFIDTTSDIFMVIEFASGGELFDLISRRDRLTEEEARRFFQQIYSSIEYTHVHRVAHRDLKPENLLLDEFNNIKLIDFGLANAMKDSQPLKTACGSPNYAAPEVISGRYYGGAEVDVWSLGVILFAMVCGSFPFDDDSIPSLFSKIKEGKYFMPDFISGDVKDLINRMLQPNPVKRITMKEIKEHPWYLKDLPKYLQDLSLMHSKATEIDMEIVRKLFTLNLNLQGRSEEEVVKTIKDKKNTDFCGVYELLYHDNLKQECFKLQNQQEEDSSDPFDTPVQFGSKQSTACSIAGKHQKHFRTLRNMMIEQDQESQHRLRHQDHMSLLPSKHADRLQRIVRKFRSGEILKRKETFSQKVTSSSQPLGDSQSMVSTQVDTFVTLQQQTTKLQSEQVLRQPVKQQRWVFGCVFKGPPVMPSSMYQMQTRYCDLMDLMTLTCEVLKLLDIEWQFYPKDLKLKCRTRIDETSVLDYESSLLDNGAGEDPLLNKEDMIKEFLRKNFLKFYINIYKDQSPTHMRSSKMGQQMSSTSSQDDQSGCRYMLDIHLFKGTLCVFMDFVRRFATVLTSACSQCSGQSCCSSSNNSQQERSSGHSHDFNNLKILM